MYRERVTLLVICAITAFGRSQVFDYNSSVSPVNDQLLFWSIQHPMEVGLVTGSGSPVDDLENTLTAGPAGPLLVEDYTFIDQIQAFDRERIPERVVHAKGAGAHGYLEVTNDISRYSSAKIFAVVPSKTRVLVRFSKVSGEAGTADTLRDTRGFAIKFYTPDGIWDLVNNNSPVFFVRDAMRFPTMIHAMRRNPQTFLLDPNSMWDFIGLLPESTFQVLIQFSDRGIPNGYRHMDGYSINTYTMVNASQYVTLVRFHLRTNQGIQNMNVSEAARLAASDPDYFIRDLYNAIGTGDVPSWTFHIQPMTISQAENLPWNALDPTKLWPESEFPLVPIGTLYLNQNPVNYFAEIEMAAFSPRRMVPGIGSTTDKVLQGRLFSYGDSQTYRLGSNYLMETTNHPLGRSKYYNYQRDGYARCGDDEGNAVNYYPNSFNGPQPSPRGRTPSYSVLGNVGRYNTVNEDNYSQASHYWNSYLTAGERQRLVANMAASLSLAYPKIQARVLKNFGQVSSDLERMLVAALRRIDSQ